MCDWYVFLFFVVLGLINKDFFKCARRASVLTEKRPISGYYETKTKVITISIILIILENKHEIGIIWLAILSEMWEIVLASFSTFDFLFSYSMFFSLQILVNM